METLIIVIISLAAIVAISYKNVKLNKQVISLYGIINGLKIENNMLENRLELLEEIKNV
jgi:Tfp pilus assembly major pilin PilA